MEDLRKGVEGVEPGFRRRNSEIGETWGNHPTKAYGRSHSESSRKEKKQVLSTSRWSISPSQFDLDIKTKSSQSKETTPFAFIQCKRMQNPTVRSELTRLLPRQRWK